jgi:dipeptidyl aminopeptidase/acylaminoacyl peptidase
MVKIDFRTFFAAKLNFCYILTINLFLSSAVYGQYEKPSDIPVEAFAALPSFSSATISPDASKMAYFVEFEGQRQVVLQSLDGSDFFRVPPPEGANFSAFRWANNTIILFQSSMTLDRWQFRGKSQETRWFSLDFETKKFTWLGKPKTRKNEKVSQYERIIDMLPKDPDHILLQLDLNIDGMSEVYKTNVRNGQRFIRKGASRGIQNWYTDNQSEIRLGNGYTRSEWVTKLKDSNDNWQDLKKTDWAEKFDIEGFTNKIDALYVSGMSPYGTEGLYELDLNTGDVTDTIFVHESVDIDYAFENTETGRIEGVVYTDDYTRIKYLDKQKAKIQASLEKALPNNIITILSHTKSKDWYFVLVESDQNAGDYYLYDRPNKELKFVASTRAKIDPELMATVKAVQIPMRDESEIPGYLIIPQSKEPKNLPTIVMPHGGPFGVRDSAEWDYEAQFYASRGYLVLKPNYRGSGGYGPRFEVAGYNQWGGLMQDDVTDATKWLINEGYSDPERICIVGSSYGGYAAVMGVIKEPGLYQCAISVNGVTNLARLKRSDKSNTIGGRSWTKRMGLKDTDDEVVSPYHRAEEVSTPVLLMSSVDDARVPWKMSRNMHKRLKKLKKESTFVKIEDGTHHMVTAKSRLTALKAAETFLADHIGSD